MEGLRPGEWPASPEGIAAAERLATIRAYVIEGGREGWESASAAKERITSCIGRVRAATTVR